jgi:hypothetical protein
MFQIPAMTCSRQRQQRRTTNTFFLFNLLVLVLLSVLLHHAGLCRRAAKPKVKLSLSGLFRRALGVRPRFQYLCYCIYRYIELAFSIFNLPNLSSICICVIAQPYFP